MEILTKVFKQIEVLKPQVLPDQVLIKVKASAINPMLCYN